MCINNVFPVFFRVHNIRCPKKVLLPLLAALVVMGFNCNGYSEDWETVIDSDDWTTEPVRQKRTGDQKVSTPQTLDRQGCKGKIDFVPLAPGRPIRAGDLLTIVGSAFI